MTVKSHELAIKDIFEILKYQQIEIKKLKEIIDVLNHKLALHITKEAQNEHR